jgi:hypothetical protein
MAPVESSQIILFGSWLLNSKIKNGFLLLELAAKQE